MTSVRETFSQPAATGIPPTLRNQFGGSLGGPIKKDKTFIFGAYEVDRRKAGGSLLTRVPTAAERAGDLSDLGVNTYGPYDASGHPVAPAARTPFAGNVIPTSRLSPETLAILMLIPLPNVYRATGTAPNCTGNVTQVFDDDQFSIRTDHYQTDKLHLFGGYSFAQFKRIQPGVFGEIACGPTPSNQSSGAHSDVRNQSLATGFDYKFEPEVADRHPVWVSPIPRERVTGRFRHDARIRSVFTASTLAPL